MTATRTIAMKKNKNSNKKKRRSEEEEAAADFELAELFDDIGSAASEFDVLAETVAPATDDAEDEAPKA